MRPYPVPGKNCSGLFLKLTAACTIWLGVMTPALHAAAPPAVSNWSGLDQAQKLIDDGQPAAAIKQLVTTVDPDDAKNRVGALQAQLLIAVAKIQLGEFLTARNLLQQVIKQTQQPEFSTLSAAAYSALGNVEIALGDQTKAELNLRKAVDLSASSHAKAAAYNNIGNHYTVIANYRLALAAYRAAQMAAQKSGDTLLEAQALANMAQASSGLKDFPAAIKQINQAAKLSNDLPSNHGKSTLLLNLGYQLLSPSLNLITPQSNHRARQMFEAARQIADAGEDVLTSAYALHYLALLKENQGKINQALRLSEQALLRAQSVNTNLSGPLLGQLNWQAGRLLLTKHRLDQAINYYRNAIAYFRPLRNVIATRYDRRENPYEKTIKPLYEEYVSLLFTQIDQQSPETRSVSLKEIRDSLEELKAAELRDYFEDSCVEDLKAKTRSIGEISSSALIIYPVSLEDRLELLLHLPNGEIINQPVSMPKAKLSELVSQWRDFLESPTNQHRRQGAALYKALVSPYEDRLANWGVETLVFVPDGELRLVPMAALWDEDSRQFLIEKYPVAITPGVSLTDPTRINPKTTRPLYAGLSEAVAGFNALPAVRDELSGSQAIFHGKTLLDESFTKQELSKDLKDPTINIVHFATHGVFSKEARQSFILSYDGKLYLDDLADRIGSFKFRDTPLDLLVLSACETAKGDERAALGLSGIAIKAGARSAVGTLWKVDDYAAALLVQKFYTALKQPRVSRAKALQQAQKALMQEREPQSNASYRYPAFWSPFILINSWL
ncbi:MAG: CHAT domain-containing protein [Thiotrichales bacterium]